MPVTPPLVGVVVSAAPYFDAGARQVMLGQVVRLNARFFDVSTNSPIEPTDPSIRVVPPATASAPSPLVLLFGRAQLTRLFAGVYFVDVVTDRSGTWTAIASCTAPRPASGQYQYAVSPRLGDPPAIPGPGIVTTDQYPILTQAGGVLTAKRISDLAPLPLGAPSPTVHVVSGGSDYQAPLSMLTVDPLLPPAGVLAAPVTLGQWIKGRSIPLDSMRRNRAGTVDTVEWGAVWADLRAALDDMKALAPFFEPPPIELPAGDVNTQSPFIMALPGMQVRGVGAQTRVTLSADTGSPAYMAFDVQPAAANAIIRDLTIEGNGDRFIAPTLYAGDIAAGSLIYVQAPNVHVEDLYLRRGWDNGIFVSQAPAVRGNPRWFKASRVHGYFNSIGAKSGSCIDIGSGSMATIESCSDEGSAVAFQGDIGAGANVVMRGCQSIAPTYYGLDVNGNPQGGVGFYLGDSNNKLIGCVSSYAPRFGYWVDGYATNTVLEGCEGSVCGVALYIKAARACKATDFLALNAGFLTSFYPAGTADAIVLDNSGLELAGQAAQTDIQIINPRVYSDGGAGGTVTHRRPIGVVGPPGMADQAAIIARSAGVTVLAADGGLQNGLSGGVPAGLAIGFMRGATPPSTDSSTALATTAFVQGVVARRDYQVTVPGKPDAGMRFDLLAVRPGTLAVGAPGSVARARTAAASPTTIQLLKNGSVVGSVVFAAGASTGSFTVASATAFAESDLIGFGFPNPADATLADLTINLRIA